jgi:hypothetical protein
MKKILIILALLILSSSLYCQSSDKDEEQTLLGSKEVRSGGYGGPELKYVTINGQSGLMVGGRGGWIMNGTVSIGGGGYGLTTTHAIKNYFAQDSSAYLQAGYGGLFLNYTNSSNQLFHFTINALIGAGSANYTNSVNEKGNNHIFNDCNQNDKKLENSDFFVFEPGVGVELNITTWFRIEMGVGYRIITGLQMSRTVNKDLAGISGNLAFKFGSF